MAELLPLLRAIRSDERGASLALVALSLVWIVALASLVVDIGGGWLSRESLIAATDAAALAAAQDLVDQPWNDVGACAIAETYLTGNAPDATMTSCVVTASGAGGRVSVTASEDFEAVLTDISGGNQVVESISSTAWGPPETVRALRPFGLCYDGSSALQQLIDSPPSGPTWVSVSFAKDDPADCGGSSSVGNFVTVDFETATGSSVIRDWMADGYPGQIGFDDASVVDCTGNAVCYERPYASNAIRPELDALVISQDYVSFPVFNYADVDQVHLIGTVRAQLYNYQLDGAPSEWFVELNVEPGLIVGTCCGPAATLSGNKVIAICGVDPNVYVACEPNP